MDESNGWISREIEKEEKNGGMYKNLDYIPYIPFMDDVVDCKRIVPRTKAKISERRVGVLDE